jgi:predicted MPP superfamily phosphohydrolase
MRISRRSFLISSVAGVAGVAAVPGYARFLEPGWLEATEKRVPLGAGRLKRDVRVLHLSDLHASGAVPLSLIEKAIELGLSRQPHLACLTGDYVTHGLQEPDNYVSVLRRLSEAVPAYASFGNHDGGRWVRRHGGFGDTSAMRGVLEDAGITCLRNEAVLTRVEDQPLHLVGIGDMWAREVEPERAFALPVSPDVPTLVLAHNPDTRGLLEAYRWDVMLSGHTHGGQIVIPVVRFVPFVGVSDERFLEGLQPWNGRYIHITRGVGSLFGVRLNCRPEVSLLTLTPG